MNVFICGTPVHIMRAIQLHKTVDIFKTDADIFISSVFKGADIVAENLSQLGVFNKVILCLEDEIKDICVTSLYCRKNGFSSELKRQKYEKIFAFNVNSKVCEVLFNLNKKNENFEYHCVEDGPTFYTIPEYPPYRWYSSKRLLGMEMPCYHIKYWWSSCPDLIQLPKAYKTEIKKLPPFDYQNNQLVALVNKAFGYESNKDISEADILIMDESHYQDDLMIDNADYNLYEQILEKYPSANILVKMHPRTQNNRYKEKFKILSNSYIPWEVYVMNRARDQSKDLILISICCSTMASDKLMFNYEGTKIYMAPLFYDKIRKGTDNAPRVSHEGTKKIEQIKQLYSNPKQFNIVNSEEELFNLLDKKLKRE